MYHDFIKSKVSFRNSYLICPFSSSILLLGLCPGFLVGILGLVRLPALLLPVTNLLVRVAGGILCHAVLFPGVWHFMQLPHGVLCIDDFFIIFCTALMALVDKPIEFILSVIAMCVWYTASISAVVASIFIANSFLIRSVSLRIWTIRNWMCLSFSASVGKLHLSTSPQICSMSSSGVLPAFILISSSWYILHH